MLGGIAISGKTNASVSRCVLQDSYCTYKARFPHVQPRTVRVFSSRFCLETRSHTCNAPWRTLLKPLERGRFLRPGVLCPECWCRRAHVNAHASRRKHSDKFMSCNAHSLCIKISSNSAQLLFLKILEIEFYYWL